MGFLMEHLNGPTSVLRRCAADCLGNLTSLPNFAHLLLESDLGAEPISSEFMQLLAARVADSAESPEVRQLACQTIVNLLHARPSGAVQTTAPELLVQCMPSDTGPEDAESAELAVLALLALSYTFPAQPSAVDIFVSSGVVPLVFSQLTPHSEGREPDMQRALDAGEWVRQLAGAGTKAPLLQQLPSWDSCGKERGNCWCINTYATVEALSCGQKLSKRS